MLWRISNSGRKCPSAIRTIYRANRHTVSIWRKFGLRWRINLKFIPVNFVAGTSSHALAPRTTTYLTPSSRTGRGLPWTNQSTSLYSQNAWLRFHLRPLTVHLRSAPVFGNQPKSLSALCDRGLPSSISCTRQGGSTSTQQQSRSSDGPATRILWRSSKSSTWMRLLTSLPGTGGSVGYAKTKEWIPSRRSERKCGVDGGVISGDLSTITTERRLE